MLGNHFEYHQCIEDRHTEFILENLFFNIERLLVEMADESQLFIDNH